ncbi:peptidyl-prolyl cis-trans isomerase [bacterium]|nr:peptidyl-prolyl cis-trans isomerase [bacterium]
MNQSRINLMSDEERQTLLNGLVQNKLIYYYALDQKLNEINSIKLDVATIENEFYYEKILREYVHFSLITEVETKSFYERLKTEVRIKQIFIGYKNPEKTFVIKNFEPVRSRTEAKHLVDSLYFVIMKQPQSFDTLVEVFSDDKNSRYLKGDVGFKRWGIRPELEENYFELETGKIGRPIEADYGFYIFKVSDRRNVENLKPYDEARLGIKEKLLPFLFRSRKAEIDKKNQVFSDSLLLAYSFTPEKANCELFLGRYASVKTSAELHSAFTESELSQALASFRSGKITIGEIIHNMKKNTQKIKLDFHILKDGLSKVAVRRIFADFANHQHYKLGDNEQEALRQYEMELMVSHAVQEINNNQVITDESVQNYYESNNEDYRQPDTIMVSEIVSAELDRVTRIYEEVKKNNNFEEKYNQAQKEPGVKCATTGFMPITNPDEIIQKAIRLRSGAVSEPFRKVNNEYAIIKVVNGRKGEIIKFEKIKEKVKEDYINFKRQLSYNEWIAKLSVQYKVQIFSDRLKSAFDIKMN